MRIHIERKEWLKLDLAQRIQAKAILSQLVEIIVDRDSYELIVTVGNEAEIKAAKDELDRKLAGEE